MTTPSWEQVHALWQEDDGAFRDIVVTNTTLTEWKQAADAIRSRAWRMSYSEEGQEKAMPADLSDVFAVSHLQGVLWRLFVTDEVSIHCHFFDVSGIEFDIDPRQVSDEAALAAVCDFVVTVGPALHRPVVVCVEGLDEPGPQDGDFRYDAEADAIVWSLM